MSVEKLMKPTECIICLELVHAQQQPYKFEECSHENSYHAKCIDTWIRKCRHEDAVPVCPICRNALIEDAKLDSSYDCADNPHRYTVGGGCLFVSCCIVSLLRL